MNKDTPAFPANGLPGMTLRAYLAAHAPAVPASFVPVMPEVVEPDMPFPAGNPNAGALATIAREGQSPEEAEQSMMLWSDAEKVISLKYLHAWHAAQKQKEDNEQAYELERSVQWPLAWADAMIEKLAE